MLSTFFEGLLYLDLLENYGSSSLVGELYFSPKAIFIGRQCNCLRPCHPWAADLVEYWHTTNKGLNVVDNLKISQSYLSGR